MCTTQVYKLVAKQRVAKQRVAKRVAIKKTMFSRVKLSITSQNMYYLHNIPRCFMLSPELFKYLHFVNEAVFKLFKTNLDCVIKPLISGQSEKCIECKAHGTFIYSHSQKGCPDEDYNTTIKSRDSLCFQFLACGTAS